MSIEEKNAYRIHKQSLATTWSPTGDRVTYSLGNELYVRDIRDGQSPEFLGHWGEMILASSWSPVDDVLAIVVRPDKNTASSEAALDVLVVDIRSGEANVLGSFVALETSSTAMDLVWSPDGQEVYWLGPLKAPGAAGMRFALDRSTVSTLAPPNLAPGLELSWQGNALSSGLPGPTPVLAPDGEQLAWGTLERGRVTLRVQPLDASLPSKIVGELAAPVWSLMWTSDSRNLIAAGNWETLSPLWIVDTEAGDTYRLTEHSLLLSLPAASIRSLPSPVEE